MEAPACFTTALMAAEELGRLVEVDVTPRDTRARLVTLIDETIAVYQKWRDTQAA